LKTLTFANRRIYSQVPGHSFRQPLVMVFAYAVVSAAQKPRHPYGGGAFSIRIPGLLSGLSTAF
jgi:hypothetical protein